MLVDVRPLRTGVRVAHRVDGGPWVLGRIRRKALSKEPFDAALRSVQPGPEAVNGDRLRGGSEGTPVDDACSAAVRQRDLDLRRPRLAAASRPEGQVEHRLLLRPDLRGDPGRAATEPIGKRLTVFVEQQDLRGTGQYTGLRAAGRDGQRLVEPIPRLVRMGECDGQPIRGE